MREVRVLILSTVPNSEIPLLAAAVEDFFEENYPGVANLVSGAPVDNDAIAWHDGAIDTMNEIIDAEESANDADDDSIGALTEAVNSVFNGG